MSVQVPQGYKQTEVGIIPEDWQALPLGVIGTFKNGINKDSSEFGHGHPFVNLMDVFGRNRISSNENLGLINTSSIDQQVYDLKNGDVLFIRSSVKPSGVGLTAVIELGLEKTVFSGFLIRFRDVGYLNNNFKIYCFYEEGFRRRIIAASSVSANTNINQDNLKNIYIGFPASKVEQQTIAEALSDADALIGSLEQLIAKKRQTKQGAMQDLLTGHRRLPGFSGEWELKRLGDIANIAKGQLITERTITHGDIPVIAGGKRPAYFHNAANRTGKTITISGSGASAGYVAFYRSPIFASDCSTIGEAKNYDIDFIYFALLLNQETIYKAQTGGAQPHIHPDDLRPLMINFPMDLSEQTAIATFIGDMEAEIFALESRLDKARQIKQSMMQELLTGRIRLI